MSMSSIVMTSQAVRIAMISSASRICSTSLRCSGVKPRTTSWRRRPTSSRPSVCSSWRAWRTGVFELPKLSASVPSASTAPTGYSPDRIDMRTRS